MTALRLHHRLHWPLCLGLAALAALCSYLYVAVPQQEAIRHHLITLQNQARLRQDSLALAPLQPLLDKLTKPIPPVSQLKKQIDGKLASLPIDNPQFTLSTPQTSQLGDLTVQTRKLAINFQADDLNAVNQLIAKLPSSCPCHIQLVALNIERQQGKLSVRTTFTAIGTSD